MPSQCASHARLGLLAEGVHNNWEFPRSSECKSYCSTSRARIRRCRLEGVKAGWFVRAS